MTVGFTVSVGANVAVSVNAQISAATLNGDFLPHVERPALVKPVVVVGCAVVHARCSTRRRAGRVSGRAIMVIVIATDVMSQCAIAHELVPRICW
jgi:hypothetical protein